MFSSTISVTLLFNKLFINTYLQGLGALIQFYHPYTLQYNSRKYLVRRYWSQIHQKRVSSRNNVTGFISITAKIKV